MSEALRSVPDICEVEWVGEPGPPELLIEVPHGATRTVHFETIRARLVGDLPDGLHDFFHVNTDVGAPECAREIARIFVSGEPGEPFEPMPAASRAALIVRGLVPRTLVDLNRALDGPAADYAASGVTKGLPDYVTDPADVLTLVSLHAAYHRVAAAAYDLVCGAGGRALMLHTYAPRAIRIERFDHGISAALRAAYEPDRLETWPRRPDVDLITESEEGERLAPEALVRAVRGNFARIGIEVTENASYRLHATTMGERYARAWPNRTLCLELNRALLADPFTPFAEMTISPANVHHLSAPIAAAFGAGSPISGPPSTS